MYQDFSEIKKAVKNRKKPILVIVSPEEGEFLKAISKAKEKYLSQVILVGNRTKINQLMKENNIDHVNVKLVAAKGLKESAETAVALIKEGQADFIMKGLVDTSIFLKAIIDKEKGLMIGRLLSSIMIEKNPNYHKFLMVTDGGMVINPDLKKKKDIIENAVELARVLDIYPIKVAALAAKEKVNPKMPATVDAADLKVLSDQKIWGDDVIVDGPMAMDLIVSKKAAAVKGYHSRVAGDADIILVPNIETGNAIIKTMTYLGKSELAGIVVGACVPIILTSRSDSTENKYNSIILGAFLVQQSGTCFDKREEWYFKNEKIINRK